MAVTESATFARTSVRGASAPKAAAAAGGGLLLLYFVFTLLPISKEVGGLLLSPLRVMLLILFVPYFIRVFRGDLGGRTPIDTLMICHAAWIFVALIAVHGTSRIPFAGITMVELVGGYFLGRVLVRDAADYKRMIRIMIFTLIFLLPFALIELKTGRLVIPDLLRPFFETPYRGRSAYGRWGLERVYTVFDHPILFGLYCSVVMVNIFYLVKHNIFGRIIGAAFAFGMTFMSLSSAPLLSCGMQFLLIGWDKITKGKWVVFICLSVFLYVVVDALSNRTPVTILIETLTFNASTGWTRIAIFESGIRAVQGSPFVGIGFNDWPRPHWLTSSVDNFWLLTAMRYGFVGAGFLVAAFAMHFYKIMKAPVQNEEVHRLRTGYGIGLAAVCFTMVTVHVWGSVGIFVMFYLGAGSWVYSNDKVLLPEGADADGDTSQPAAPISPFTRSVTKYERSAETTHKPSPGLRGQAGRIRKISNR